MLETELLGLYRPLKPATRSSYRKAWRVWRVWCESVGLDPLKVNVPQAQQWIDSMLHDGAAPGSVRAYVKGVRITLEYLAMVGYRPYEPLNMVELPALAPIPKAHSINEQLTTERLGRALYDTRTDTRAHAILWACAGMGLGPSDMHRMSRDRLKRVGSFTVAVVPRGERGHLVPVPRELELAVDELGAWPIVSKSGEAAGTSIVKVLRPYLVTNARDMRDWWRGRAASFGYDAVDIQRALNDAPYLDGRRFAFSEHPAVHVCGVLRESLLDICGR